MHMLLEMREIVKRFGAVKALNGVSISLAHGEVLSLCGENGSGKSTLMKVLCGIYPHGDFEGEILVSGKLIKAKSIADTEALGIAIIHQELTLVKELSVLENLFLGAEIEQFGVLNYEKMYSQAVEQLNKVKLDVKPETLVGDLGVGQQQLVEIAKALSKDANILVLDEPTAPLTESETTILLDLVKDLRQRGVSCIYISHKLNEVMEISDRVCVVRDGVHIGTHSVENMTTDEIITMMVGREMKQLFPREEHTIGETILRVSNVSAWDKSNSSISKVKEASFSLKKGEILGVSGLVGAGRTELMECLFGCYKGKYHAHIELEGKVVSISSAHDALAAGIAMVPEDRKRNGIIPIMSVGGNITLAALDDYVNTGVINDVKESSEILTSITSLTVKTPSPELEIKHLSGGNQQKAILARFLLANPKVLILDEPTRGIDVGAKYEIYKLIFKLVHQGISVILVSSELPEILGISDRVLVMHEGTIKGDLVNQNLTQEIIMDCALLEPEEV